MLALSQLLVGRRRRLYRIEENCRLICHGTYHYTVTGLEIIMAICVCLFWGRSAVASLEHKIAGFKYWLEKLKFLE